MGEVASAPPERAVSVAIAGDLHQARALPLEVNPKAFAEFLNRGFNYREVGALPILYDIRVHCRRFCEVAHREAEVFGDLPKLVTKPVIAIAVRISPH